MALNVKTTIDIVKGNVDVSAVTGAIEKVFSNLGKLDKASKILAGKPLEFFKTEKGKEAIAVIQKIRDELNATIKLSEKGFKVRVPVAQGVEGTKAAKGAKPGAVVGVEAVDLESVKRQEKLLDLKNRMVQAGRSEQTVRNTIAKLGKLEGAELAKGLAVEERRLKREKERQAVYAKLRTLIFQMKQVGMAEERIVKTVTKLKKQQGNEFTKQYAQAQRNVKAFKEEEKIRIKILVLMQKYPEILDRIDVKEKEITRANKTRLTNILKQAQAYEGIKLVKQEEANKTREISALERDLLAAGYKREKISKITTQLKKAEKGAYRSLLLESKKLLSEDSKRKATISYINRALLVQPIIGKQIKREFGDISKLDPFRLLKAKQRVQELQAVQSAAYRSHLELDRISNSLRQMGMMGLMAFGMMLREAVKFNLALVRLTQGYSLTNKEAVSLAGLAESTGIEIDSLTKGIGNYFQKIITAGQGTSLVAERVREALQFAGLEAVKLGGRGMPAVEMLDKMRKVFQGLEEPQDRAYLGQMVFGGEFEKFLPLLQMTDTAFTNIIDLFENYADLLDKDVGQSMIDVNAQLTAMKYSVRILATIIATKLQPTFESLSKLLQGSMKIFKVLPEGFKSLTANLLLFLPAGALFLGMWGKVITFWKRANVKLVEFVGKSKLLSSSFKLLGISMAGLGWIALIAALVAVGLKMWNIIKYNKELAHSYDVLKIKINEIIATNIAYAIQLIASGKLTEMQSKKVDGYIKKIKELDDTLEGHEKSAKSFWTNKQKSAEAISVLKTSIEKTDAALKAYIKTIKNGNKDISELPLDLTKNFDAFAMTVSNSAMLATQKIFVIKKIFESLRDTIKEAGGDTKTLEDEFSKSMIAIVNTALTSLGTIRAELSKPLPSFDVSKFGAAMEKVKSNTEKTLLSINDNVKASIDMIDRELNRENKSFQENEKIIERTGRGIVKAEELVAERRKEIAGWEYKVRAAEKTSEGIEARAGLKIAKERLKQEEKYLEKAKALQEATEKDLKSSITKRLTYEFQKTQATENGEKARKLLTERQSELILRVKEKFAQDEKKILLKLGTDIDTIERNRLQKQQDTLRQWNAEVLSEEKAYWQEMANVSAKYGLTAINDAFLKADEELLTHRKETALIKVTQQEQKAISNADKNYQQALLALKKTFSEESLKDLDARKMYDERKLLIDKKYNADLLSAEQGAVGQRELTEKQFQLNSIKNITSFYHSIIKNEQYTYEERQQLVKEGLGKLKKLYEQETINADQYRNSLLMIKSSQLDLERAITLTSPFDKLMKNWDTFIKRFGDFRDSLKKEIFDKMTSDFKSFFGGLIEAPKDFFKNFMDSLIKIRQAAYIKLAEKRAGEELNKMFKAGVTITPEIEATVRAKYSFAALKASMLDLGKDLSGLTQATMKGFKDASPELVNSFRGAFSQVATFGQKTIDKLKEKGIIDLPKEVKANVGFNILPEAIEALKEKFSMLLPSLEVLVKPVLSGNLLSLPPLDLGMGAVTATPATVEPTMQSGNTEMSVNFNGITDTREMVDLVKQEIINDIELRGYRK